MELNAELVIGVIIAIVIIGIIITIISKIFESIFFGIITAIVVVVMFTVTFGDGTQIIKTVSSFMSESIGEKIEDGYEFYKNKEKETPLIDADKVSEYVTDVFDENVSGLIEQTLPNILEEDRTKRKPSEIINDTISSVFDSQK